jgi:hypothetical protein
MAYNKFYHLDKKPILWEKENWAYGCDFISGNLTMSKTERKMCSKKCYETEVCSHYIWSEVDSGTCWLKYGTVTKNDAFHVNNNATICGLVDKPDNYIQRGELIWGDEFNYEGKPSAQEWGYDIGNGPNVGWGNGELEYYTDRNANVSSGYLTIEAKKEEIDGFKYTSSRIVSKKSFKYGIFEIRAKLPRGSGTWPAFWLLSDIKPSNWPENGEIDVLEHIGKGKFLGKSFHNNF